MIRFSETEIRNSAKETMESLEHWSRRIINDKLDERYGKKWKDMERNTLITNLRVEKV